jgi:heat shock protein HspQ
MKLSICAYKVNFQTENVEQQPCWVIMLEVLDNLPHDLVYSKSQLSPWMEVLVENKPERYREYLAQMKFISAFIDPDLL